MGPTAALLLIGNELLSGKVQDANTVHLAALLRAAGIELRRICVVPDERAVIATEVNALRCTHDWLFTSGGVGPTHDDVTVESVALALGRAVVRDAEMESLLRNFYGERCTEGHLRMADVVEGTTLVDGTSQRSWPTMLLGNVAILPGVPELFARKLEALRPRLFAGGAAPFVTRSVLTLGDEGTLRPFIDAAVARFATLSVGSYPRFDDADHTIRVTFDGHARALVDEAADFFARSLPEGVLVRLE